MLFLGVSYSVVAHSNYASALFFRYDDPLDFDRPYHFGRFTQASRNSELFGTPGGRLGKDVFHFGVASNKERGR